MEKVDINKIEKALKDAEQLEEEVLSLKRRLLKEPKEYDIYKARIKKLEDGLKSLKLKLKSNMKSQG